MPSAQKTGRPVGSTGQAATFSDKELKQVLAITAVANRHGQRNVCIVVLSNYLGLRAKELAALKIGDVFDGQHLKKVLRLVAAYTKGAKHRDISLENKMVVKALQDYLAERRQNDGVTFHLEAPLFRSQKKTGFSPNSMVHLLSRLYARAGFKEASSHSGRRSLITKLAYAGIDLNSIRQIAGHASISTTQRYIDDNPQRIAEILKSV